MTGPGPPARMASCSLLTSTPVASAGLVTKVAITRTKGLPSSTSRSSISASLHIRARPTILLNSVVVALRKVLSPMLTLGPSLVALVPIVC